APWAASTFWMYTILLHPDQSRFDSRGMLNALAKRKIQTRPLWQPIHLSPAHRTGGEWHCPVAEVIAQRALSLPCSVGLEEREQDIVISNLVALLAGKVTPAGLVHLQS